MAKLCPKSGEGKLPSRIHQESGRGGKRGREERRGRKDKKGRNKKNRKIQWGTFDGKPFSLINMPSTKNFDDFLNFKTNDRPDFYPLTYYVKSKPLYIYH